MSQTNSGASHTQWPVCTYSYTAHSFRRVDERHRTPSTSSLTATYTCPAFAAQLLRYLHSEHERLSWKKSGMESDRLTYFFGGTLILALFSASSAFSFPGIAASRAANHTRTSHFQSSTHDSRKQSSTQISWFKKSFGELTWDETAEVASTPREICSRVRRRVYRRKDDSDEWASGRQTWQRGYGDCEDLAACIVSLCRERGIDARVLVFHPAGGRQGHAVVVGKWRGKLWLSSNGWYQRIDSLEDAKRKVAVELGWGRRTRVNAMPASAFRPTSAGEYD